MNIAIINKNTNICENVAVFEDIETANDMFFGETGGVASFYVREIPDGYGIGDVCDISENIDGIWSKVIDKMTNIEKREEAYESMVYKEDGTTALIMWENAAITVDVANKKWLDYSAEGSTVANDLSALIVEAKAYIRELYPDE